MKIIRGMSLSWSLFSSETSFAASVLPSKRDHCFVQLHLPSQSIKGEKLPQNHQNQEQTGRWDQRYPHESHVSRHPLDRDATRNKSQPNEVPIVLKPLQSLHLRAEEVPIRSNKRVVEHLGQRGWKRQILPWKSWRVGAERGKKEYYG